jgi:hypothetical protein
MVAAQRQGQCTDRVDRRDWVGSAADQVAEAPRLINAAADDVIEHLSQPVDLRVNVGADRQSCHTDSVADARLPPRSVSSLGSSQMHPLSAL